MRIKLVDHAVKRVLNQQLFVWLLDIFTPNFVENIGEQRQLLIGLR